MDPAPHLPRAPLDLWPALPPAKVVRSTPDLLTLQVPAFAKSELLVALSRSTAFEMRTAGEWAARGGEGASPRTPREQQARDTSRFFADRAARLLSLYAGIHGTGGEAASSQFSPDIVQEHATTTYRQAFHDERKLLRRLATPYNDTLYDSVQPEAKSGSRPRRHR